MSQTKCFTWRTSGEYWYLCVWYIRKQLGGVPLGCFWPVVAAFDSIVVREGFLWSITIEQCVIQEGVSLFSRKLGLFWLAPPPALPRHMNDPISELVFPRLTLQRKEESPCQGVTQWFHRFDQIWNQVWPREAALATDSKCPSWNLGFVFMICGNLGSVFLSCRISSLSCGVVGGVESSGMASCMLGGSFIPHGTASNCAEAMWVRGVSGSVFWPQQFVVTGPGC